jgi:HemK-related putative methylase
MPSNVPYGPAEDTWLLEDSLMRVENVVRSAEVGCGTGYITKILAEKSVEVVAIEKDAESAYLARENLRRVLSNVHIIIADGLSPIHTSAKLDLIVSNPPYLPLDDEFYDPAIHGGPTGVEVSEQLIKQALPFLERGCQLYLISSSLNDQKRLLETIRTHELEIEVVSSRRIFFEEIACLRIRRTAQNNSPQT